MFSASLVCISFTGSHFIRRSIPSVKRSFAMLKSCFKRYPALRSLCLCGVGMLLGVAPGLLILQVALAGPQAAVSISGFQFTPKSITIHAGEIVTWTNQDPTQHTVTAANGEFDSGSLSSGMLYSHTFTQTGVFSYHCSIHSGMTGAVNVITGTQVLVYAPVVSNGKATR
jgi:plastocyanin